METRALGQCQIQARCEANKANMSQHSESRYQSRETWTTAL